MKSRILISFLLSLVIALNVPFQVFAAEKSVVYVSEVMVGMGETAEEAKKALTDAGFTVLDRNLNEGAGSALKTEKFVYLGYKTTTDPNEAITDLAVMNMNGGYSFSDYEALMAKYRDSQIKPFIDNFIATIEEYRANYNSDNENNKAKADYAFAILNNIREDDTGGLMGELLLNPTKEELGLTDAQYKALPDEERAKTVDLTTAMMQGNAQIIMLIEQTLAMAADTNDTTWMERLSELGPDGLDEKYAEAGVRPTDASREMASLYDDAAKKILGGWDELRTGLLDYDRYLSEAEPVPTDADDIDVSDLTGFDLDAEEKTEIDLMNPNDMLPYYTGSMENSAALAEEAADHSFDGIYHVLKEITYGEGTMYDFFTQPYEDVSGGNVSVLYPMVSTLTDGQIAAIDFLTVSVLVQIGSTVGDAFEQFSAENSGLFEGLEGLDNVSLYYSVNRELFGDKTALTSEVLRDSALVEKAFGLTDPLENLGGLSALSVISWTAAGSSLLISAVSAARYAKYAHQSAMLRFNAGKLADRLLDQLNYSEKFETYLQPLRDLADNDIGDAQRLIDLATERTEYAVRVVQKNGKYVYRLSSDITWGKEAGKMLDIMRNEELLPYQEYANLYNMETVTYADDLQGAGTIKDLKLTANNIGELESKLDDAVENCQVVKSQKFWRRMEIGFNVAFAVLALTSIVLTAYDLYRYYNVDYTPIPKYIVDEADITTLDADGNKLVVRNDAAYYTVAPTNRPKTHKQFKALQDYADLNGDAGKEWLALYSVKLPGAEPILADSFKVVTGSTSMPEGYTKGIHMFGSNAAANLTDNRYTYNDKLNGMYVYFKTEASASTDAASTFSGGALALVGTGGAAVGAALGAVAASMIKKKKTNADAE